MQAEQSPAGGTPTGAVSLSYASGDTDATRRLCDALRAAGIEVWFDQSELRGGDAWNQKIRQHIHGCALFVPIISAQSEARHEGYFRREWRLYLLFDPLMKRYRNDLRFAAFCRKVGLPVPRDARQ
jgi:TIR domain